jgi:hypothetical protein
MRAEYLTTSTLRHTQSHSHILDATGRQSSTQEHKARGIYLAAYIGLEDLLKVLSDLITMRNVLSTQRTGADVLVLLRVRQWNDLYS